MVNPPGLSRGPVQTPRCHQPSELCSPALSSQQEQKDWFRSASDLYHTKSHIRISICAHFHTYPCINYQPTRAGAPERTSAMPPQALGDDMDVPFISWVPRSVQLGTDAMAPPGALMLTPRAPSVLGPLEDQVYWFGGSFSLREYSATIMSGVT